MKTEVTELNQDLFIAKLKQHRHLFYWGLPACFIVFFVLGLCVPKYYESSFIIARESEQAVELQRTITLNNPENYDLGLVRTDNAVSEYGYRTIVTSPQFLCLLFDVEVQTMNGQFQGSYFDYLTSYRQLPFWTRWKIWAIRQAHACKSSLTSAQVGSVQQDTHWMTKEQWAAVQMMKEDISATFDRQSMLIEITVQSQDPMVSAMLAEHVERTLRAYVTQYEKSKMQCILTQLGQYIERLETEDAHPSVLASFHRQYLTYEAQMMFHNSFATISAPQINYLPAGPSYLKWPLILTIFFGLLALAIITRRELWQIIKAL